MHWGIGGTSYCKNMVYENSTLSRFDAHEGLYNGKIVNSTISGLEVTGWGELLIDGTRWFASSSSAPYNAIISLRSDYGCTWNGDIIIKNVDAYAYETSTRYFGNNPYVTALIYHAYSNWYFGYDCHFPNLTVDNLEYYSRNTGKLIPADTMGAIELAVSSINSGDTKNSFITEPNLHLDTTKNTNPFFPDVDNDKDGKVDGTDIDYDKTVSKGGVEDKSSYQNLNKIVPPEYIKIVNNKQGYDFISKLKEYKSKGATFFDNTTIIVIEPGADLDHVKDEDAPITPY